MADDEVLVARGELELPEGGMVEATVFLVSYIDTEGNSKYAWSMRGESSVATMIGLIDFVKFGMLVEAMS